MTGEIDLRFRTALDRLDAAGRLLKLQDRVDPYLEAGGLLKKLDGDYGLLFERVGEFDLPVVANLLASHANTLAIFGLDTAGIRERMQQAFAAPIRPEIVVSGPCQETVRTTGIDLPAWLPAFHHAPKDGGRFITGGIVICRDDRTGVHNASFHRLQLVGPDRTAIKLDDGRHLTRIYQAAKAEGRPLPISIVLGPDLALFYAAVGSGSILPMDVDELDIASGVRGAPLPVVRCITNDLLVPAESEIVIEGVISIDETVHEGPFVEFLQLYSDAGPAPVVQITAVSHRTSPYYYACLAGIHGAVLRKYIDEANLLHALQAAVPIVSDVCLTPASVCKFHAIVQVAKRSPRDEGLQRNAIFATFAALKDVDLVTMVDDDIDPHDSADVEWAVMMRFDAAKDLVMMPGARTHEYIRVADDGVRGKLALDATVRFEEREKYRRVEFSQVNLERYRMTTAPRVST